MCSKLVQIYQKRTPTFLAQGALLTAVVVLLVQPEPTSCSLAHLYRNFYWALFSVGCL